MEQKSNYQTKELIFFGQMLWIFILKSCAPYNAYWSSQSWVVTKISNCRVFVVSSRGSRKQSWSPFPPPPPLPQEGFEVQLLPFSKRHYRPKKAIFIKSTAIISGFMMITSLLKKTTTFWDTKIIVKLLYVKARWRFFFGGCQMGIYM